MNQEIITIKIGTSVSFTNRGVLDEYRIGQLASQICKLHHMGKGVVLVASGAVACGHRVHHDLDRASAAGVGQAILTSTFLKAFENHNLVLAQILVRAEDITTNLAKTVHSLLSVGMVPLFNENDVVNNVSDFPLGNDFLAVAVAKCIGSKQLFILSTMKGSSFGVGGGSAKLQAVKEAQEAGIKTQILNGKVKDVLLKSFL